MGPRGPPGPSGAPVSKENIIIIIIILYSQLIEKYNIMLIIFSAETSIDEIDMSNILVPTNVNLFSLPGPQGFQGNGGEAG